MELSKAVDLLEKISTEIDEFFKTTNLVGNAPSTDIYDFVSRKEVLRKEFPTGKDFKDYNIYKELQTNMQTTICEKLIIIALINCVQLAHHFNV